LGALASIPRIGSQRDPVTQFLAGVVMFTLFMGIPVGAPIGAVIGLIVGGIRGWKSWTSAARTKVPMSGLESSPAAAKGAMTPRPQAIWPSWGAILACVLAIPGAFVCIWLARGYYEGVPFRRFCTEVEKLGGHARDEDFEGFSFTVESIELDLSGTATDDDALERLTRDSVFQRVRSLSLAGTRITDRSLAVLDAGQGFHSLDLSHTSITDRGIRSISRFSPRMLKLSGTCVTDATLDLIEQQAKRAPDRIIDVTDTQVTYKRVRELGKAHPTIHITHESSQSPSHAK